MSEGGGGTASVAAVWEYWDYYTWSGYGRVDAYGSSWCAEADGSDGCVSASVSGMAWEYGPDVGSLSPSYSA